MTLEGKVAIVTGGGQGIGRGIALRLAREGAAVAVVDLNPETGQATALEIQGLGGRATAITTDISVKEQVDQMVEETLRNFGAVDILVNNAAFVADIPTPFIQETEEYWDKVVAVSLKGAILCSRAALTPMMEKRGGKIVNIASDAGRVGQPGQTVYAAAKGGIMSFTKSLAREVARYNINVNSVSPGTTDTPAYAKLPDKIKEVVPKGIPLGRIAQPEDIAATVAFLCSSDSDYITGQILSVSGGYTTAG